MNIDQLKTLVRTSIVNSELNLDAARLESDAVTQLAASYLPGQITIKIKNVSVDEPADGKSIKVTGDGSGFPFEGMNVIATFDIQNNAAAVIMRGSRRDHWRFDHLFPQLSNSIFVNVNFTESEFCLASYASTDASQGLSFSGLLALSPLKELDFLFGNTGVKVSGPIELDHGAPKMALKADMVSNLGLGFLNLPSVRPQFVSLPFYNSRDNKTNADAFVLFEATIAFTANENTYHIPLSAKVYSLETNILFVANFTEAVDASMAELSSLLNGMGLGDVLPDSFRLEDAVILTDMVIQVNPSAQNKVLFVTAGAQTSKSWTLIEDQLTLERVKFFFRLDDPSSAKRLSLGVNGELRLGDMAVLEFAAFSDDYFSGGLKSGSTLHLKELCKHFGLDDPHIPELNVDELDFTIQPKSKTYSFRALVHTDWQIGVDDFHLKLEEVLLSADHSSPDVTDLEFEAMLEIGGVTFDVTASRPSAAEGLSLSGRTGEGETVHLSNLIGDIFDLFDFDVPESLPDISVKNVSIDYNFTTQEFAFHAENEVVSSIRLGNTSHQVDTTLDLKITKDSTTGHRTYSGRLLGSVTFGSAVFQGEYDFGDMSLLKATWDGKTGSLGFSDLAASHGIIHDLPIPDVSLELTRAAFEFDLKKSQFRLSADSAHGEAFFVASNANQKWDFAFGILMDLSSISGFPNFGLSLQNTMLILSTVADDNFKVPVLPAVPLPAGQPATGRRTFPAIGTTKMRLRPGVTVAALLDLKGGDKILSNFGTSVLKREELLIQVAIGSDLSNVSFLSYLEGSLTLDMGVQSLVLSDPLVRIDSDPPTFGLYVQGTTLIPFNHVTLKANGAVFLSDKGLEGMLQVTAQDGGEQTSIPMPFGLRGVSLDEIDIELGVIFVPAGIILGIEGKFHIKGQTSNANNFIIVLDPKTGIPNPIYLSAYVQSLTISDLITAVSGEVVSGIPEPIKSIQGKDLSVYWSESAGIVLPDGRLAQQGFGFNGFISIGGYSAHAALTVSEIEGVSGDAELPPINLSGVFSLTGNGKGVKVNQFRVNGGEWQTMTKPPDMAKDGKKWETQEIQLIPAGGATMQFNSKHSPYLDVSAAVSLFDLLKAEVEIEVSNDGFKWKQKESIGSLFRTEFDCQLSKSGFHAAFDIDIKGDVGPIEILGVDLGSIDLDVSFSAGIAINASTVTVSGSFHFEGFHLTMPEFSPSDLKSFEDLPDKILKQIQDNADDIFAEVFDDAGALLKAAAAKAEKIVGEAAEEAEKIGAAAAQQAEQIGAGAKAAYEGATHDVAAATDEAKKLGEQAENIIGSVDGQVNDIGNAAVADAKELEHQAEEVGKAAVAEVSKIGGAAAAEAKQIAADAQKVFDDASKEVEQIGKDAEKAAEAAFDATSEAGKALLNNANAAANAMKDEAEKVGREIAGKVAEKARKAAEWTKHQAEELADAASSY